jgi:thiol:disulfide interchange protein DsbD
MPYGLFFGAIYFGLIGSWLGLQAWGAGSAAGWLGGPAMILLGISLSVGLLRRRGWARWTGVAWGFGLTVVGGWLVNRRGGTGDFLVLFASVAAVLLLLFAAGPDPAPATGRAATRRAPGWLGWVTVIGSVGVLGAMLIGASSSQADPVTETGRPALPPSRAAWLDFGAGLELARAEGKPLLVNFVASWCGYCRKMDRETWKHPEVVDRLGDVVTVRVDIDDSIDRAGYAGTELAGRYAVQGVPAMLLMGTDGRVLARTSGYLTSRQLLGWLDDSINGSVAANRSVP